MKPYFLFISLIIVLASCHTTGNNSSSLAPGNKYSGKFSLHHYDGFTVLSVNNPWQNADQTGFTYVLTTGSGNIPDSLSSLPKIHTPVKNIVVFSTTHIGFISALQEENSITGASGLKYVYNSGVRKRIEQGKVKEIGYAPSVDYEAIISLNPDIVLLYGLNSSVTGIAGRLAKAGIPSVIIAEYLEKHPLGKMEWIKVFGALYGKEKLAGQLFNHAVSQYNEISMIAVNSPVKPAVMAGLPWKDTWYMAGGDSFMARLIHDAGGAYLWGNNSSTEYVPLSLESVFIKAFQAQSWINCGSARTLSQISARDERFKNLPVFQEQEIYNNDKRLNGFGGNDYWESGVVHPDDILADLVKIFHPGLAKQHEFVYYRKME